MSIAVISPDWFVMDRLAHVWTRFSQDSLLWYASLTAWERRAHATELLIFDAQRPVSLRDLNWLKRLAIQIPTLLLHEPELATDDLLEPNSVWLPIPGDLDEDSLRVAAVAARLCHRGDFRRSLVACSPKSTISTHSHGSLEARLVKWTEVLSSSVARGSQDSSPTAHRLRSPSRLDDLTALLSNRLACRRQWIRPETLLQQLESRGLSGDGLRNVGQGLPALRLDLQHTLRSIDEVLAALETPSDRCSVEFTETDSAYDLRIIGTESITTDDFASLEQHWAHVSWPDFDSAMEFTAGLGLSRERLRCQGAELGILRDSIGRFGFCVTLPKNEPASYLPGFVSHLQRRLEFPGTEVGFFLVQEPSAEFDLGEVLAPWLGSCGWIQQRGETGWLLIAPVSRSEVTEFFEALEEQRRQVLTARGLDSAASLPFQASVVAHVRVEEDLTRWSHAFEAAWQQADALVTPRPLVVLAHEASPWFVSLATRLSDSGGEVVRASVAEPFDLASDDPVSLETSTVLDLRPPQAADWSRLERLVGDGLLHRRIYLLTDDLRKQNDRLASWVEAWGERIPNANHANGSLLSRAEHPTMDWGSSRPFVIDGPENDAVMA